MGVVDFSARLVWGSCWPGERLPLPVRTWRRLQSRSGHLRRAHRSDAPITRFSPSRRGAASRTSSMQSRKKTSSTPAGCDVTAIRSSFSSNGCPSSRSRRRTRHHHDLPLALMTRHRLSSRVRRPKPLVPLPSGEISRKSQARLHALPSDIPLHWPCRHTAIESNLGRPS